jgi:acetate kinase
VRILTLNTGSSSLKFQVSEWDAGRKTATSGRVLATGSIRAIGDRSACRLTVGRRTVVDRELSVKDHGEAVESALRWMREASCPFDAVGHRIVHGGERFRRPVRIDDSVIEVIRDLSELAPIHNPIGLAGIRACRRILGRNVPMVAVFDTAFHSTMPRVSSRYAIPSELARRHAIRRYGFHGIAHAYLAGRYLEITGTPAEGSRLVTLQLGHGCSATAVRDGRSVDTSMGFTPLEGLVMATRSGDLDPAIVAHLCEKEQTDASRVVDWLNHRSGLLGLSEKSGDMSELLALQETDDGARLAVEVYCYRIKKTIGAFLSVLSGADAVIFGGGVGENAPEIRRRVCEGMAWCGIELDSRRNEAARGIESRISRDASPCRVEVIPTDEAAVISRETFLCLTDGAESHSTGRTKGPSS